MTAPIGAGGEHDSGNSQFDWRQGVQSRFVEDESGVPPSGNGETGIESRQRPCERQGRTDGRSFTPDHGAPVVNKTGKRLGEVPQSTTSAGAGKIARGEVVFSRRFGYYAWVKE